MSYQNNNEYSSGTGCLLRFYWMFIGNMILAVLLAFLLQENSAFPSPLDGTYLLTVASLIVVRYIDICGFNGGTGNGSPATKAHWRKYSMVISSVSLGLWLVVRFVVPLF